MAWVTPTTPINRIRDNGNDDNNNIGDLRRSYTTSIQLNKHLCAGAGSPGGGHLDHLLEGGGGRGDSPRRLLLTPGAGLRKAISGNLTESKWHCYNPDIVTVKFTGNSIAVTNCTDTHI